MIEKWAFIPQRRVNGWEVDRAAIDDVIGHVDDVDEVGERHRLAVDARAAEEPHRPFARGERGSEIGKAFRAGEGAARDDEVAPPGSGASASDPTSPAAP